MLYLGEDASVRLTEENDRPKREKSNAAGKQFGQLLSVGDCFYHSWQRNKSVHQYTSNHEQPVYVNRENCSYACLNEDHERHVVEVTRTFLSRV
ncbi:hypothetical protein WN51_03527 [Melipona quadrifasciata]|uniref:Uncharacterized protein n=1 Tax=Melipona quadrifasciata TaxID=166423 RepID=A0A0M8ZVQ1_9HYME|nr:hypothetical protein WN51_03527 [Melipona quadrifasciata]